MTPPSTAICVYEDSGWQRLLPLVYLRAVFQLRFGIDDLLSKVRGLAAADRLLALWCRPLLEGLVRESTELPVNRAISGETLLVSGRAWWRRLPEVEPGGEPWVGLARERPVCVFADASLARRLAPEVLLDEARSRAMLAGLPRRDISDCVELFDWPWQIVHANRRALEEDWQRRHGQATSTPRTAKDVATVPHARYVAGTDDSAGGVAPGSYLLAPESVHIGAHTRVKPCVVIDAEQGPVWIGRHVTIQPHCYVQGPAAIGDHTLLQPGAIIREGTSIGPWCKVGGEVEASILQGFSNKQHDGFLGHSYVGAWVNIAADCINSDLKNTYGTVRVPINGREVETGEMFVGMLVGDYSKAGINVSFPTGAVMGFSSSVFAARSPKFVPSFAWLDGERSQRYDVERALAIARKVMQRRNQTLSAAAERAFLAIPQQALAIEYQPQLDLEC